MSNENIITLDLTECKYLGELHKRIKTAFDFPEYYGENWNAFWDLLWSECSADKVEIIGEKTLPKELSGELEIMHDILDRLIGFREEYGDERDKFEYQIIS